MKKLTPVLLVDRIEPCLSFWCDRLGFARQVEVPHGAELGFVILVHGPVEVMLQSRASVAADLPALAGDPSHAHLFVEVDDLAPIRAALAGLEPLFAERTTPYGAREVGVRDPAGNAVVFAQFAAAAAKP
jgi:catechol 2,3-dioxygenase-like lactoylglutathione lyase family enzyme